MVILPDPLSVNTRENVLNDLRDGVFGEQVNHIVGVAEDGFGNVDLVTETIHYLMEFLLKGHGFFLLKGLSFSWYNANSAGGESQRVFCNRIVTNGWCQSLDQRGLAPEGQHEGISNGCF